MKGNHQKGKLNKRRRRGQRRRGGRTASVKILCSMNFA
jgi:hypothetical protein